MQKWPPSNDPQEPPFSRITIQFHCFSEKKFLRLMHHLPCLNNTQNPKEEKKQESSYISKKTNENSNTASVFWLIRHVFQILS